MKRSKRFWIVTISAILAGIAAPIIFWFAYLNLQNVSPGEAISLLSLPESHSIPQRTFSLVEQTVSAIAEYGFSNIYKLTALALIILLWRKRSPDLVALRRGLISSLLAELVKVAGTANFLGDTQGLIVGYLYGAGEAICFSLVTYALMVALDERIFKFSCKDGKCALLNLCRQCHKYSATPCNLRLLFLFTIAGAAIISLMPLTAGFMNVYYKGVVFGETEVFGMPLFQQILALRVFPIIGFIFIFISWVTLLWKKEEGITASKDLFAIGLGPVGYSLLTFMTYWGFQNSLLWAEVWEECSEVLFIMGVAVTLFVFRKTLFGTPTKQFNGDVKSDNGLPSTP